MNDGYEEVLKLAAQLGEAIRRQQRYVRLREADEQVRSDKSATDALEGYNKAAEDAARKERSGQPVEVEDKRRLRALQETVAGNASIKAFMSAQADYAELMHKMNDAIYESISSETKPEDKR